MLLIELLLVVIVSTILVKNAVRLAGPVAVVLLGVVLYLNWNTVGPVLMPVLITAKNMIIEIWNSIT